MKPTIYPALSKSKNRELLKQDLNGQYDMKDTTSGESFKGTDLCLIDVKEFNKRREQILTQKERSEPIFWPVLLMLRSGQEKSATILSKDDVDEVVNVPVEPSAFRARIDNLLKRRQMSRQLADYNQNLESKVQRRTREIQDREEEIIQRLASASKYRDQETGGHIRRIGLYAEQMADTLNWEPERVRNLRLASMMHDIGKLGIPDEILQKPGDLTDEEFETMKDHSTIGADIVAESDVAPLKMAQVVARHHHEQWDGSGYPDGLSGETIPEEARVVAVADVYDALVHDRVYRDAMPEKKVLDIIREDSGSHFDPDMVECFLNNLPSIRAIRQLNPEELSNAI